MFVGLTNRKLPEGRDLHFAGKGRHFGGKQTFVSHTRDGNIQSNEEGDFKGGLLRRGFAACSRGSLSCIWQPVRAAPASTGTHVHFLLESLLVVPRAGEMVALPCPALFGISSHLLPRTPSCWPDCDIAFRKDTVPLWV